LNVLDFLFGLSALRGDPHFVFTDEATFQPPEEGFLPVSKFLAFTGAKRILKKVMAEKKRALKPPPAAVPASTGASASSSSLLSSTAGAVAAVIPTPIPPPAPKPTAPATNHVDYQQSKKEKKKTRPPPAPAAQPPPLVPSPKPPAPVAPAPADSDDDDDYPAAIKLGALIKILTNKYGLVFLRHRGRQIYAHPADSRKRPIPVPHGSLGKDVKRGAVRAILNNAKEAHTRAKKEK
jgi:predicted RNA binding protein YcfA (HicA-like mRNA interferase family)